MSRLIEKKSNHDTKLENQKFDRRVLKVWSHVAGHWALWQVISQFDSWSKDRTLTQWTSSAVGSTYTRRLTDLEPNLKFNACVGHWPKLPAKGLSFPVGLTGNHSEGSSASETHLQTSSSLSWFSSRLEYLSPNRRTVATGGQKKIEEEVLSLHFYK